MEGLSGFIDPMVMSLAEFTALGRNHAQGNEALWDAMVSSRAASDLAILVYTSGTTGPPKGAMHSNRSVTHQMRHANDLFPSTDAEERLVFLPLCHVAERIGGYYISLALGSVMNFAESPETVPDNLREVQPTAFLAVPRIWEKFYSGITIALKDATPFQNWMYRHALAIGNRMTECRLQGEAPPLSLKLANHAAYWLVFRNIRRMLGLDRCRIAFTGAAPIAPDLIRWYLALGIDMREVYGQTENCGVATMMPADRIKLGSVGKAAPWGEVMICPKGEILIKGDFLFMGYLNQPEKTAETIDAKGWLHTGDVGSIDNEGFVKITDRMKDIIITSGGKNITPSEIENQLKFSPYVSDAVVIGDKRPYLTCLVMIDHENVEKFAQDHDIPFTNYASLCRAAEIQDLILREIEAVNANFARVETIKKFFLIERQLTPEDEELTPTMKLKRSFVNKRYAAEIGAMYGEREVA
jgi:long-chain acyl-CoA synthetase